MPVTVMINTGMSAVHSGSNGVSIAFPDVCKTQCGPATVPIPYPNIAMSSDAASQASTVKFDGEKVMIKSSNFKLSSGDEAGSLMGVASSKNKGKAEPANYSFDIKVDGENVQRLADPMQQNGSSANAFGPATLQAPVVVMNLQGTECDKVKEAQPEEESSPETDDGKLKKAGIEESHFAKIKQVAARHQVQIWFRSSNQACAYSAEQWIAKKHCPKPHGIIAGKTTSEKNVDKILVWAAKTQQRVEAGEAVSPYYLKVLGIVLAKHKAHSMGYFHGLVQWTSGEHEGMPILVDMRKYGMPDFGCYASDCGANYQDQWVTGDYDLMDLISDDGKCLRKGQTSYNKFKRDFNKTLGWDGLRHGPQSAWDSHGAVDDFHVTDEINKYLDGYQKFLITAKKARPEKPTIPKKTIAAGRPPFALIDNDLTVVYPGGVVALESDEDVAAGLMCMGCLHASAEE